MLLLSSEVERISSYTGLNPLSFASPISNGVYRYKMKKRGGKCVFLDGKACRIYKIRPIMCKIYPFSVREHNGTLVFEVCDECPGVGLGKPVPEKFFRQMAREVSKAFHAKN